MHSNFDFLNKDFPVLANFGKLAEQYCFSDPNSCLIKLGMIGETIVNLMFTYDDVTLPDDNTAVARIGTLAREGLLSRDIGDILHALRKARNKASHENYGSTSEGKILLQMAHSLCEWFMQTYGDWNYQNQPFVMPQEIETPKPLPIDKAKEKEIEENLAKKAAETAAATPKISQEKRKEQSIRAAGNRPKSEAETRYLIDEQLRRVGWEADTESLRYAQGTRPQKGRCLAIAEWPTDSQVGNKGYVDYALFIGTKLVAVIEAKAMHKDIPSVIDYQCKDYAGNIRAEDSGYLTGTWGAYRVPFTFATNGRAYLEQIKTKSGIWFLDLRQSAQVPRALKGWMSPAGLEALLTQDIESKNQKLKDMSFDLLTDHDGLHLRPYQLRAIQAAEKAIIDGKDRVLLAMATGTGKTRTVLGMIYRFLKAERFRRILFLVDRTALGEQAQDVFKEVKLENLMTLSEIYNIKELEDKTIDKETRVQVATVQSMIKRILYPAEGTMPSVSDYDLIIVDEAHRGYILDKEMSKDELLYRSQTDYQSKYRSVIEYFDAVKIGLTATPALQTTEIFGKPVFKYTYREAVIEGYLVDHDAPHALKTRLSTEGIQYKKGDIVTTYDAATGELTNSELLDDELDFDIDAFNRRVITESFNRIVLTEIAKDIDPQAPDKEGKTLIYAVNDHHADMIVSLLKEIYGPAGVDNNAILKITGSIGGGDKRKVQEAIKRFKNETYPSIAVTVDLLTTGIDVPEITRLVFLRRVKSRILFEQMLGRATRLCPKLHKTHFEIYDPVSVYDSLEPVSTMKPVVTNPGATYDDLVNGLEVFDDDEPIKNQIQQIIAKLQRQKKSMDEETIEHFTDLTGGLDPDAYIRQLQSEPPQAAKNRILANRELFHLLQETKSTGARPLVISDKEDELISHTRGYGGSDRPEEYLGAFSAYLKLHMNEIAALHILCTSPKDLTREDLKSLRLTLDREGFTTQKLNTAISQMTKEEIAADIISLIRRYALGANLVSHEARIRNAVSQLTKAHKFSPKELSWIKRMETYLMKESVLNPKVFDEDLRFKEQGGFKKINTIFQNNLETIVLELNTYLYDDGGHTA